MVNEMNIINLISLLSLFLLLNGGFRFIGGIDVNKIKLSCKGQHITLDQKVLGVLKSCKSEVEESRKKINLTIQGMGFDLCAVACALKKEKLVNDKGKLEIKNLENFYGMLTKVPNSAQEPLKKGIKSCFHKFENRTFLDPATPNNCWGLVSLGLCAKGAVDGACKAGVETTTEGTSKESSENKS